MCVLGLTGVVVSVNVEFPTGNASADTSRKMNVNGFRQAKGVDRTLESAFVDSQVPQCSDHHVSADAREAVEVESAHTSPSENLLQQPRIAWS
jgi:hypothetical protein